MDNVIPFVIIGALVVLMIYSRRRQAKRSRSAQEARAGIEVGVDVMTTSGLYGRVVALGETTIDLEVSEGVVVRFARAAVREVVSSVDAASADGGLVDGGSDHERSGPFGPADEEIADQDTATAFADSSAVADTVARADSDGTPR